MDLSRVETLLGDEALSRLASVRIAVVGVGGVGSWCAEALVRTGVRHLMLMDDDVVEPSNLNRQCPALEATIGIAKVEAMKARLLSINPECKIETRNCRFVTYKDFGEFDLIVDAIDSVDCKAELILSALAADTPIVSSLGAASRTDPTKVEVRRFDKVEGDGLARALRQRFKKLGRYPKTKFYTVMSTELPQGQGKGSIMPVTCAFGMALASEAIRELTS